MSDTGLSEDYWTRQRRCSVPMPVYTTAPSPVLVHTIHILDEAYAAPHLSVCVRLLHWLNGAVREIARAD